MCTDLIFRPARTLPVWVFVMLVGCGPAPVHPVSGAAQIPEGPLTDLTERDIIQPYITACDGFATEDAERIERALGAVEGSIDRLDGTPHSRAAVVVTALRELDVDPRVSIPERGFMTVDHSLIEQVQKLATNPPKTKKERKAAMELGQKVAKVMPHIMALNSHLYEIQTAQVHSQVHVEACTAYPIAAAVAIGNARHQNLIPARDPAGDAGAVRAVLESSHKTRAKSSALLAVFASLQATIAGDMEVEEFNQMLTAARENLQAPVAVEQSEVDEIVALAWDKLEEARAHEAELKALAEQTMRPPPPRVNDGEKLTVGKVVGSVLGVLGSLATGNISGVVKNVAAMVPERFPLKNALRAGEAVMNGDYRTALDAATKLAPADSPLARARGIAARVESRAAAVQDQIKVPI